MVSIQRVNFFFVKISNADHHIDDFLNNSAFLWNIKGAENITILYEKYPKEIDTWFASDKLYGYPAGDERLNSAKVVIKNGTEASILIMFNSFYGPEFFEKGYTFAMVKVKSCLSALNKRSQSIQDVVRKEYFYKVATDAMNIKILKEEFDNGKLNDDIITSYTAALVGKNINKAIEVINHLYKDDKYKELQILMVTSNNDVLDFVSEYAPKLLPQDVVDLFVFK